MIKYDKVLVERDEAVSMTCDKCGKVITQDGNGIFEWQEKYCIRLIGGYSSVFGDGAEIACDLCQDCLKELIGPYCRID